MRLVILFIITAYCINYAELNIILLEKYWPMLSYFDVLLGYDQTHVLEILKPVSVMFKCLPANCLIMLMRNV